MVEIKSDKIRILIGEQIDSVSDAWQFVQDPVCGATQLFTGTTRNHHDGKKVTDLYYDCYEEMAGKETRTLLEFLLKEYSIYRIALFHKTGHTPIGEISMVTAISAPHRQPALEATKTLIDEFKQSVPIWKRETFEKGETYWKEELINPTSGKL